MEELRFREARRALPGWGVAVLFLLGAAVGALPFLIEGAEVWPGPIGMVAIWLLLVILRLTVEVTPDEIRIAYRPFPTRRVPVQEISDAEVITYRPLRERGAGACATPANGTAGPTR